MQRQNQRTNDLFMKLEANIKPRLHIHDFLYDSPRFTPISHGQKNRDESWRKVEIFSVTAIPVRMSTILVRCLQGIATNQ